MQFLVKMGGRRAACHTSGMADLRLTRPPARLPAPPNRSGAGAQNGRSNSNINKSIPGWARLATHLTLLEDKLPLLSYPRYTCPE